MPILYKYGLPPFACSPHGRSDVTAPRKVGQCPRVIVNGEFSGTTSRPVGLANDLAMALNGTQWKSQNDLVRGRVRMYRAF